MLPTGCYADIQPDWTVRKITEFGKALPTYDDDDIEADADAEASETVEADAIEADFMPAPTIIDSSISLGEFESFDDILSKRTDLESALYHLKNDANFHNKKIRFVLELAFD